MSKRMKFKSGMIGSYETVKVTLHRDGMTTITSFNTRLNKKDSVILAAAILKNAKKASKRERD